MQMAICIGCADVYKDETLRSIIETREKVGVEDWSVEHDTSFLTPQSPFPTDKLWHLHALLKHEQRPTQQYPPHNIDEPD